MRDLGVAIEPELMVPRDLCRDCVGGLAAGALPPASRPAFVPADGLCVRQTTSTPLSTRSASRSATRPTWTGARSTSRSSCPRRGPWVRPPSACRRHRRASTVALTRCFVVRGRLAQAEPQDARQGRPGRPKPVGRAVRFRHPLPARRTPARRQATRGGYARRASLAALAWATFAGAALTSPSSCPPRAQAIKVIERVFPGWKPVDPDSCSICEDQYMAESGNNEELKKQHALEKVRPCSLSLHLTKPQH